MRYGVEIPYKSPFNDKQALCNAYRQAFAGDVGEMVLRHLLAQMCGIGRVPACVSDEQTQRAIGRMELGYDLLKVLNYTKPERVNHD